MSQNITPLTNKGENAVFTFYWLYFYLRAIHNILMTLLACSQVSNRCPLGYLFLVFLLLFVLNNLISFLFLTPFILNMTTGVVSAVQLADLSYTASYVHVIYCNFTRL